MSPLPPILTAIAALVLGSCGPGPIPPRLGSPSGPAATSAPGASSGQPAASAGEGGDLDGLWLLVGGPGAMRLVTPGPAPAGDPGAVPPPLSPAATWASGDRRRGFVASVGAAGRTETIDGGDESAVASDGKPAWRQLRIRLRAGADPRGSPAFATLSPDGRSFAVTVGDPSSGAADARLVVADRATGLGTLVTLGGRPDGRPPTWLGPDTVAVPVLDLADAPRIAVVDLASGQVTAQRGLGGPLAGSADGRLVAAAERTGGRILVGPVAAIGGRGPWIDVTAPDARSGSDAQIGQLLLDGTGRRLAVASIGVTGDAVAVTLYRRDAGGRWAMAATRSLPSGATRVVLVGFDP